MATSDMARANMDSGMSITAGAGREAGGPPVGREPGKKPPATPGGDFKISLAR